mgnify:CR=1 FL=1
MCGGVDDSASAVAGEGNSNDLARELHRLPQEEFTRQSELLEKLHPVVEEQRKQASTSVVGRLRALLPI